MKDEKQLYGAVDEYSSEQRFRKSDAISYDMWKIWSPTPSGTGSYGRLAGRQADEIEVRFEIFKIHCGSKNYSYFSLQFAKVQPNHSSTYAFR